jgi:hypothetical protein
MKIAERQEAGAVFKTRRLPKSRRQKVRQFDDEVI